MRQRRKKVWSSGVAFSLRSGRHRPCPASRAGGGARPKRDSCFPQFALGSVADRMKQEVKPWRTAETNEEFAGCQRRKRPQKTGVIFPPAEPRRKIAKI